MPGVEPGAIVEYRWQEFRSDPRILYARLQFQREFPVQKVTYFVRPLPRDYTSFTMNIWPFNCKPTALKREDDGYESTSLENVPAFHDEPMMPGEPNVRPWALISYREDGKREPEKYWNNTGKDLYNRLLKPALKANDEIKQAAAGAVEGASSDEQKVLALIKYIRKNLRNLFGAEVTEAERAKILKQMPKERADRRGSFQAGHWSQRRAQHAVRRHGDVGWLRGAASHGRRSRRHDVRTQHDRPVLSPKHRYGRQHRGKVEAVRRERAPAARKHAFVA